jgi:hypothetical protein
MACPDVPADLLGFGRKGVDGSLNWLQHRVVVEVDGDCCVCRVGINVAGIRWVLFWEVESRRKSAKLTVVFHDK